MLQFTVPSVLSLSFGQNLGFGRLKLVSKAGQTLVKQSDFKPENQY
jgi:hypothetical protein